MDTKRTRGVPARLERLRRRFERWRRTHKARSRIPEPLWASAVKLAGTYGLNRTARTLRLDYYAFKKRLERWPAAARHVPPDVADHVLPAVAPAFLELPLPAGGGVCECTVEWENAGGAKMRVHLKGVATPDLAALSRSFWSPAS